MDEVVDELGKEMEKLEIVKSIDESDIIQINGNMGSGGGQIMRTGAALSYLL